MSKSRLNRMMYGAIHPMFRDKEDIDKGCGSSHISCGVRTLYGVHWLSGKSDLNENVVFKDIMEGVCEGKYYERISARWESLKTRFIMFSDADRFGGGRWFANFLREQKLGHVIESRPAMNENSGNLIRVWIWELDYDALAEWSKKNGLKCIYMATPSVVQGQETPANTDDYPAELHSAA